MGASFNTQGDQNDENYYVGCFDDAHITDIGSSLLILIHSREIIIIEVTFLNKSRNRVFYAPVYCFQQSHRAF